MVIDLNKIPGEGSEEHLPDLNQEPDDGGGDEIHLLQEDQLQEPDDDGGDKIHFLQEDQLHLIKEAQAHPLEGQSHYLHKDQQIGVHAIDLNNPACEGQEEFPEGNSSVSFITTRK